MRLAGPRCFTVYIVAMRDAKITEVHLELRSISERPCTINKPITPSDQTNHPFFPSTTITRRVPPSPSMALFLQALSLKSFRPSGFLSGYLCNEFMAAGKSVFYCRFLQLILETFSSDENRPSVSLWVPIVIW